VGANKYLYNGKELLDDQNLGLYDYGARYYDPVIGRWTSPDPLASEREWVSPYNFVQNNPMSRIDPDGMFDIRIHGENNSSVTVVTDLIDIDVNAGRLVGDLGGNYTLQGSDVTIAALDIVGIFDPSGVADVAAATLEAQQGNYGSAILSGMGVFPLIGDLGKLGKVGNHMKTINNAIDAVHGNSKLSQKAQHGYEIFNKKTGDVLEYGISGQKRSANQVSTGGSPRIDQKIRTKYPNDPDIGGRVIDGNLGNRQSALDWEKGKVDAFKKANNGQSPPNQKRPK
jgi:RHS repeat-associated protein